MTASRRALNRPRGRDGACDGVGRDARLRPERACSGHQRRRLLPVRSERATPRLGGVRSDGRKQECAPGARRDHRCVRMHATRCPRPRMSGCCWRAKAGARGMAAFWPGVRVRLAAKSARRAGDRVMTRPLRARNAPGRTSFNPARSSAAVYARRNCVLLNTGNDGMFAGLSGGTALLRSWLARRIDSALAGVVRACAPGRQATRQQRLELRTIVWSVVPVSRSALVGAARGDPLRRAVRASRQLRPIHVGGAAHMRGPRPRSPGGTRTP
jgi:hypothetical protein